MFIKSKVNDCVVNSDQITYMDIELNNAYYCHEDEEYKYHLVAYTTDDDYIILIGTDDIDFARARMDSLIDSINDHVQRVHVVDGQISNYPC